MGSVFGVPPLSPQRPQSLCWHKAQGKEEGDTVHKEPAGEQACQRGVPRKHGHPFCLVGAPTRFRASAPQEDRVRLQEESIPKADGNARASWDSQGKPLVCAGITNTLPRPLLHSARLIGPASHQCLHKRGSLSFLRGMTQPQPQDELLGECRGRLPMLR